MQVTWPGAVHRSFLPNKRSALLRALPDGSCPYTALGVERGATRAQIRSAYIRKIKDLHPDLNSEDTTAAASVVNLAYEELCAQQGISLAETDGWHTKDVFDQPFGPPEILFVNPFSCQNVNPLEWRSLQALAQSSSNPEDTLMQNGVSFTDAAICYLTEDQMKVVEMELDCLSRNLDFDFCAWTLNDYLIRARQANRVSPN